MTVVRPSTADPQTSVGLVDTVRRCLADAAADWQLVAHDVWVSVVPPDAADVAQGWKIHVSATPGSTADVLAAAVPVLVAHRTAFKLARDVATVRWLTGRDCDRALAGKVVTCYPPDDHTFARLAAALHDAVGSMPAPRILSDRPYRPGSAVHYRYGGFRGDGALDSDGVYRYVLHAPDGSTVEDRREAWFDAPPWAPCPLDQETSQQSTGGAVLLGGHYVVRAAIRHSAKGGVYLAEDTRTGTDVVVKHARANAELDGTGADARDLLRNEAGVLRRLAGVVPVPEVVELFEQDGDAFLAVQRLAGRPLRSWVHERSSARAGVPWAEAEQVVDSLLATVAAVHRAGLVLRDVSPTNVLVTAAGDVQLVDLELAAAAGGAARRSGTPAYQAPERRFGDEYATATPEEDRYGLGALLFLLGTGCDPLLPDGTPEERSTTHRLLTWYDLVAEHGETARELRTPVHALLAESPTDRPAPDQAHALPSPAPARTQHATPQRLLTDGITYLLTTMSPDQPRLWHTGSFGRRTDAGNVQHGAAGVLTTLVRTLAQAPAADEGTSAVRAAADWLAARPLPRRADRTLPGLYFGGAGVAWALAEAAAALDDDALAGHAVAQALQLPTEWPNPDVAHGLAGACLTHLRLARLTGDNRLRARADAYADLLAAAAEEDAHGPSWRIPRELDSMLAGKRHHGFAHGAAGIGYALLANGRAQDLELAVRTGHALCAVAAVDEHGAARWAVGPEEPTELPHWCSGSSGVGTFLVRLHARTGEQRFADLAAAAAVAVHRSRWQSSPVACHGLAGDGQFLLDAAELLVDPTYHEWAVDLADCIAVRHCERDGLLLTADETGRDVVADHQVGTAGVVAFLARLLYGGSRVLMLDEVPGEADRRC